MEEQNKYTIESKSVEVQCSKTFLKILNLLPGPNETFVLLAIENIGKEILVHMDSDGKIIFQHHFSVPIDQIHMISQSEVMTLQTRQNQIKVFNLTTKSHINIPFNFINEQSDQAMIYTFKKSKKICVVEQGNYNDNRLKLSYFSTPLSEESRPLEVYETDTEWTYEYLIKKANEESMVVWFKPRNDTQFSIKVVDTFEGKQRFKEYKIKNQIGLANNHTGQLQTAILNIWQMTPNQFCLVCCSQKTQLGLKNKDGVINNNFIWNVSTNQMRQANFYFDEKYNDFLIDMASFGDFSVFRTFFFNNGIVEKSPCYFINNQTQKIAVIGEWQCTYRVKHEYPCFSDIVVQNEYENGEVSAFKMTIMRIQKKK